MAHQVKLAQLLKRRPDAHKGDHGSLGIAGGAQGMVGAVCLAGRTAIHSGAGRVYAVRPSLQDGFVLDTTTPELMVIDMAQALQRPINAWVAGPGLGASDAAHTMVKSLLALPLPLLLDADALNMLADDTALAGLCRQRSAPTILTPHPGEASRLLHTSVASINQDREGSAREMAQGLAAIVILKGPGSVITTSSGVVHVNDSGNAALATAGTGDVLSGLIGALLAQRVEALLAAREGARIHGLAAERATLRIGGMIGVAASDLIPEIRRLINEQ
jgi:hydroxyethylthiazole kinase-like uncharacterized protein yjeF